MRQGWIWQNLKSFPHGFLKSLCREKIQIFACVAFPCCWYASSGSLGSFQGQGHRNEQNLVLAGSELLTQRWWSEHCWQHMTR